MAHKDSYAHINLPDDGLTAISIVRPDKTWYFPIVGELNTEIKQIIEEGPEFGQPGVIVYKGPDRVLGMEVTMSFNTSSLHGGASPMVWYPTGYRFPNAMHDAPWPYLPGEEIL